MPWLRQTDNGILYPFDPETLRAENPETSFPERLGELLLAGFDVLAVEPTVLPECGPDQRAVERQPLFEAGVWRQQWAVRQITSSELNQAKGEFWSRAKAVRDEHINAGCNVPGIGRFDTDDTSRGNINGAVTGAMLAAQSGTPFQVSWKLADNTVATIDGAGMVEVGVAVLAYVSACHARAQAFGEAIQAASSMTDLLAIDISAGWPG